MKRYFLSEAERQLYKRYADLALPRHTSYPISPVWRADYQADDFRRDLQWVAERESPLSLYVHVPFCEQLCYYCACTKEIIPAAKRKDSDAGEEFLQGLEKEANRFRGCVRDGEVQQIHLGGGSPTFLNEDQLERLATLLTRFFSVTDNAEIAIEVDPRITTYAQLQVLRDLGFNRISLGIQDFDLKVQKAVNREQSFELVERLVKWCRDLGFASLNFDLIYGLPFQSVESMAETLEKTVALGPDRIAFYRLAVIPDMFRWQRTFSESDLPSGELSLELNLLAINRFLEAGYEFIGLDHFSRPSEDLAQAHKEGSLRRNFQGMTTGKHLDILGLGPSAISQLEIAFGQNHKTSQEWASAIDHDFAICRGMPLSEDDRIRRELMGQLYGFGTINKRTLEKIFGIHFDDYFAAEMARCVEMAHEGLLTLTPDHITLTTPLGRLLVRVVAAAFDAYLPPNTYKEGLPDNVASRVG